MKEGSEKIHKGLLAIASVVLLISLFIFVKAIVFSPNVCSGQWTNCVYSFNDDEKYSVAKLSSKISSLSGTWNAYNINVPDSSKIDKVAVSLDFYSSKNTGYFEMQVSSDGGITYGPIHKGGGNTAAKKYTFDVTNEAQWTGSKLRSENLKIKVNCIQQGKTIPYCYLDHLPIDVQYTPFSFTLSSPSPVLSFTSQGKSASSEIYVNKTSGGTQTVSLTISGCPPESQCTATPSSAIAPFKTNISVITGKNSAVGRYNLTIYGSAEEVTKQTTYKVEITDTQPWVFATSNPMSGNPPLTVNLTSLVNYGESPFTYLWNFGDGITSSEPNPMHTFTSPLYYNVTLTVTDFDGDSASTSTMVFVYGSSSSYTSDSSTSTSTNSSQNNTAPLA